MPKKTIHKMLYDTALETIKFLASSPTASLTEKIRLLECLNDDIGIIIELLDEMDEDQPYPRNLMLSKIEEQLNTGIE